MMMEVKEELIIFLLAVVSGGIVRLSYRFLHCVRQIVRHNLLAIEIEDFLFWIFSALFLFVKISHTPEIKKNLFVFLRKKIKKDIIISKIKIRWGRM